MVYVSDDGTMLQSAPWSIRKVFNFFASIIYMFIMFFRTLISPNANSQTGYSTNNRPGFGPPRRLGRPNTGHNIDIPFGGCRSCAG